MLTDFFFELHGELAIKLKKLKRLISSTGVSFLRTDLIVIADSDCYALSCCETRLKFILLPLEYFQQGIFYAGMK